MKRIILGAGVILALGVSGCNSHENAASKTQKDDKNVVKTAKVMKSFISIVEIPTSDFSRAVGFYQSILGISIEEMEMDGVQMGVFPDEGAAVNVVLVRGNGYKPSTEGTLVYLRADDDLQVTLDKVEANGGKVVVPKTEISPEMGFFAMFTDTEGNKVGLHSLK